MRVIALVVAALWINEAAWAEKIVGRTVVSGRTVLLLDNNTWRFEEETSENCNAITTRLSFCGDRSIWAPIDPASNEIAAQYRYDDRNYAQYIVEELGTNDGLTLEGVRNVIISHAASASNISPDDVIVYDVSDVEFQGKTAETVTYQVIVDGARYVFMNTLVLEEDLILQAISYAVGDEWTEEGKDIHRQFLEFTEVNE